MVVERLQNNAKHVHGDHRDCEVVDFVEVVACLGPLAEAPYKAHAVKVKITVAAPCEEGHDLAE